jgi:hypothetical protein
MLCSLLMVFRRRWCSCDGTYMIEQPTRHTTVLFIVIVLHEYLVADLVNAAHGVYVGVSLRRGEQNVHIPKHITIPSTLSQRHMCSALKSKSKMSISNTRNSIPEIWPRHDYSGQDDGHNVLASFAC